MGGDDFISGILIALLILAVVFFILREMFCWYWKINRLVDLQEKQNALLEKLSGQLSRSVSPDKDKAQSSDITDGNRSEDEDDDISRDNLFK
jgi:hypothetical protein